MGAYQYLQTTSIPRSMGPYLSTPLVNTLVPFEVYLYEHLEYAPIINARAHQIGFGIANDKFKSHYNKFLNMLCFAPQLGNPELMAIVYYLLLQDRVTDAKAQFARITYTCEVIMEDQETEKQEQNTEKRTAKYSI